MQWIRTGIKASLALVGLLGLADGAAAASGGGIAFRGIDPVDLFPEQTCTQCHVGGTPDMESVTLEAKVNGMSASEYRYSPGETVSLIVDFSDPNANRLGFLVTARSGPPVGPDTEIRCGSGGMMAPAATPAGATVKQRSGAILRNKPEPCGDLLENVWWATHNRPTEASSATWEVSWTMPAEDVGPITLVVMANGANGNRQTSGDKIYRLLQTIESGAPPQPPEISGFGDVLAGPEGMMAQGAPGAIASVTGAHFEEPGAASASTLDETGRLATVAGGTCVEVGPVRAPLMHLTSERITFQIPSDAGLGNSTVKVIRRCDTAQPMPSEPVAIQIVAARPAFLQFSDDDSGLTALRRNLALVAPAASVEGRRTRPAMPGDEVVLFGTGFGPVVPPYASGEIATELRPLAAEDLRVMLGDMELDAASVDYAGAAPDFAGLQQLTLRLPENAPPGSHDLAVLLGGVKSPGGPKIEVAEAVSAMPPGECTVELMLGPADSCTATFTTGMGILEVDTDGKACVLGSDDDLETWRCGVDALDLSEHGAEIGRNEDGTWTITVLPEETGPQACEVGLTISPGESCRTVVFGIEAFIEVSDEGIACAGAPSVPFSICDTDGVLDLAAFGADVQKNDDGSWTLKKLP